MKNKKNISRELKMRAIVAALSWIFFGLFVISSFFNFEDYLTDHEKKVESERRKNSRSVNYIDEKCDGSLARL